VEDKGYSSALVLDDLILKVDYTGSDEILEFMSE
jgi:hypothetical protein